jgi:hypothetical protein
MWQDFILQDIPLPLHIDVHDSTKNELDGLDMLDDTKIIIDPGLIYIVFTYPYSSVILDEVRSDKGFTLKSLVESIREKFYFEIHLGQDFCFTLEGILFIPKIRQVVVKITRKGNL